MLTKEESRKYEGYTVKHWNRYSDPLPKQPCVNTKGEKGLETISTIFNSGLYSKSVLILFYYDSVSSLHF